MNLVSPVMHPLLLPPASIYLPQQPCPVPECPVEPYLCLGWVSSFFGVLLASDEDGGAVLAAASIFFR